MCCDNGVLCIQSISSSLEPQLCVFTVFPGGDCDHSPASLPTLGSSPIEVLLCCTRAVLEMGEVEAENGRASLHRWRPQAGLERLAGRRRADLRRPPPREPVATESRARECRPPRGSAAWPRPLGSVAACKSFTELPPYISLGYEILGSGPTRPHLSRHMQRINRTFPRHLLCFLLLASCSSASTCLADPSIESNLRSLPVYAAEYVLVKRRTHRYPEKAPTGESNQCLGGTSLTCCPSSGDTPPVTRPRASLTKGHICLRIGALFLLDT